MGADGISLMAAVADRLADTLDRRGAPNELLEAFQEQETASMCRCAANSKVEPAARMRIMYLIDGLLRQGSWKVNVWFEAVRILDSAGSWPKDEEAVEEDNNIANPQALVTYAAALCVTALALEGEGRAVHRRRLPCLALAASSFSTKLGGGAVSAADVTREQCSLLLELDASPSLSRWLSAFMVRFDVATNGHFTHVLEYLECITSQFAANLLQRMPASEKLPLRTVAIGTFAAVLICSGVLPANALRPTAVDEQTWDAKLLQLRLMLVWMPFASQAKKEPKQQEAVSCGAILAALELATLRDTSTIREQVQEVVQIALP